jgi:hypothetical protein
VDYDEYVQCFNTGDDRLLVDRFFHDDVVVTSSGRECRGKAELLSFLEWAHDGVREVIRPRLVLRDAEHIFAEIDMDFHALAERPHFPFGALCPGDMLTLKFFATYGLRDGKVAELKTMNWPAERGVSSIPRLGPHPSQVAAFHSYAAAFSNADCDRFTRFYTSDVMLELGRVPPIHGPDGIAAFYRPMFERVREKLTIHSIEATDEAIHLDATTRFTAIADAPDFVVGPLRKGDFIEGRIFVDYALRDGLICRISVHRNGDMVTHRREQGVPNESIGG